MYNMLCGNNPLFWFLARVVEQKGELPKLTRFRDIWTREVNGKAQVVIYTRMGGNNREASETVAAREHPLFVETWDDAFDSTFAHFAFKVPDRLNERMLTFHRLFSRHPKGMEPKKKFDMAMAGLKGKTLQDELPNDLLPVVDFSEQDMHAVIELVKSMLEDMREGPSSIERRMHESGIPQTYSAPKVEAPNPDKAVAFMEGVLGEILGDGPDA